jgi:hypothetical protein
MRSIVFALCFTALCAPVTAKAGGSAQPPPPWLSKSLRGRLHASSVPVLLPVPPSQIGPIRSVPLLEAGRDGYYVGFSTIPNCGGGSWCTLFYVGGTPAQAATRLPARYHSVRLDDGTRARYAGNDCSGASCTGGSLIVERDGVDYELDARLADNDFSILQHAYHTLRRLR